MKETIAENFRWMFIFIDRVSCMAQMSTTVGITTATPPHFISIPFFDNIGRQFQNENHTSSLLLQSKLAFLFASRLHL